MPQIHPFRVVQPGGTRTPEFQLRGWDFDAKLKPRALCRAGPTEKIVRKTLRWGLECVDILQREWVSCKWSKSKETDELIGIQLNKMTFATMLAWSVHFYTALGVVLAFAATIAVFDGRYRAAFLVMVAATVIDATDGFLARRARVKDLTPLIDGARLDDIIDYSTFVFVPVLVLYHAGDLPPAWGFAVASVVLVSSAYGFSASDAKTDDHFFTGFPSYWNIVALYLHAAGLPVEANAAILLVLSGLVFVRIGYVYPTRTPVLRGLTIGLSVVWSVMIVLMILALPHVPRFLLIASLFFPLYYTGLSAFLHARRVGAN
jgi:phosphatidylcholine synthase